MTDKELAVGLLGRVFRSHAEAICMEGLSLSELGGAVCCTVAREKADTAHRSVVVVLCGPIPDDLIQMLGKYAGGLAYDLKNEKFIKDIYED